MTDTYNDHLNGDQRPIAYADLIAGMSKDDYPEVSFKDGDSSKVLKFTVAERGLAWLYANRPMVFADMMLAVYGISATAKEKRS